MLFSKTRKEFFCNAVTLYPPYILRRTRFNNPCAAGYYQSAAKLGTLGKQFYCHPCPERMSKNMRFFKSGNFNKFFKPVRIIADRPGAVRRFACAECGKINRGYSVILRKKIYLVVKALLFRAVSFNKILQLLYHNKSVFAV